MALSVFGIDFGTNNIKIYNGISKTITTEKNIIAIKDKTEVLAFGDEAFEMYEKNPDNIAVDFLIKAGVIADLSNMMTLFEMFYKVAWTKRWQTWKILCGSSSRHYRSTAEGFL